MSAPLPTRIVFYDGVCGFCNHVVQVLLRLDRQGAFLYAPLQGETADEARRQHPEIPTDLDTFVLLEEGKVYLRSRAFAQLTRQLAWPWRLLGRLVRIVPRPLADLVYDGVAKVRYRVWGKLDACPLPAPQVRRLFLP